MMIKRSWLAVLAGAFALIAGAAIWWWMGRPPSADKMMSWLPEGNGATLHVDFAILRQTGMLARIAGTPATEEPEYKKFVEATGFNYRSDLDAVLAQFRGDTVLYVVAGKFDDAKLQAYAQSEGGRCVNGMCSMPASSPGRQISFVRLTSRTIGMAVSTDPMAAALISTGNSDKKSSGAFTAPMAIAWVHVPAEMFRHSDTVPPGMSMFLQAFRGADSATLLLRLTKEGVDVVLEAPCLDEATAKIVAGRLLQATALLKSLMEREGMKPEPDSLSGVLTSGEFRADGSVVRGYWPMKREFLEGAGK